MQDGRGEYASINPDDDRAFLSESEVMEVPAGDPRASYVLRYRDTDDFTPTVTLDASYTLDLDLSHAWRGVPDPRSNRLRPRWQRTLRVISTETNLQVSETESLRTRDLYLVKFWTFRDPGRSPTIRGSLAFIQDLSLWNGARGGDLRFRFRDSDDYDASLLRTNGTAAVTHAREYSTRARRRFAENRADWVGEYSWEREDRTGSAFDYRARRSLTEHTLAWHPSLREEFSFTGSGGTGWDPEPDVSSVVDPAKRPARVALRGGTGVASRMGEQGTPEDERRVVVRADRQPRAGHLATDPAARRAEQGAELALEHDRHLPALLARHGVSHL